MVLRQSPRHALLRRSGQDSVEVSKAPQIYFHFYAPPLEVLPLTSLKSRTVQLSQRWVQGLAVVLSCWYEFKIYTGASIRGGALTQEGRRATQLNVASAQDVLGSLQEHLQNSAQVDVLRTLYVRLNRSSFNIYLPSFP